MKFDRYDSILLSSLIVIAITLVALLFFGSQQGEASRNPETDRTLAQAMAREVRTTFLRQVYAPVEDLVKEQRYQQALLKLQELERKYPGEAHGHMIKARVLRYSGATEEALESFVQGIRLNADYIEKSNPLSERKEIAALVEEGLPVFIEKNRANPDNPTLKRALTNLRYLQSRLAGGCE